MLEKFNFSMAELLLVMKVQEPYVSPLKCKIRLGKKKWLQMKVVQVNTSVISCFANRKTSRLWSRLSSSK